MQHERCKYAIVYAVSRLLIFLLYPSLHTPYSFKSLPTLVRMQRFKIISPKHTVREKSEKVSFSFSLARKNNKIFQESFTD